MEFPAYCRGMSRLSQSEGAQRVVLIRAWRRRCFPPHSWKCCRGGVFFSSSRICHGIMSGRRPGGRRGGGGMAAKREIADACFRIITKTNSIRPHLPVVLVRFHRRTKKDVGTRRLKTINPLYFGRGRSRTSYHYDCRITIMIIMVLSSINLEFVFLVEAMLAGSYITQVISSLGDYSERLVVSGDRRFLSPTNCPPVASKDKSKIWLPVCACLVSTLYRDTHSGLASSGNPENSAATEA